MDSCRLRAQHSTRGSLVVAGLQACPDSVQT